MKKPDVLPGAGGRPAVRFSGFAAYGQMSGDPLSSGTQQILHKESSVLLTDHTRFLLGVNPAPGSGELSVIFSGEGDPVGGHKIGPAVHDYYLIHTVISGSGRFVAGGQTFECRAGDTFVIFPGELFSYEADAYDPWRYAWVAFTGTAAYGLLAKLGVTTDRPVIQGAARRALPLLRRIRRALERDESPQLADLESAGYLRLLLAAYGAATAAQAAEGGRSDMERQIAQAVRLLSTNYAQPISIDRLSRSFGYHRTHFSTMFKRAVGMSPKQYLLKIRMERAASLLMTALPVEQVASSVGFGDPLYFSKQFRRWSGMSPTDYRNAKRRAEQS